MKWDLGRASKVGNTMAKSDFLKMAAQGRKSLNHASGSHSATSDDRFTAMLRAFTNLQKTQAEQQAKVNEDNA
ncbi:hypothetical protein MRB53_010329 [Persea americana]|uniref:Uncharacterized protein n=1 Tax=Persea americana TaxID=3435 RepID=A0ACC2LSI4_PERAE|nr:hypothetical protein MRB53_010329 [Persea americana]